MQILLKCEGKQCKAIIESLEQNGVDNFVVLETPEDFVKYYSKTRDYKNLNKQHE